jgi:hypothetical protein
MSVKKVIIRHINKFEIWGSRSGAPEDSSIAGRDAVSLGKRFPTLRGTVRTSTSREHLTLKMKELHSFEKSWTSTPTHTHTHKHIQWQGVISHKTQILKSEKSVIVSTISDYYKEKRWSCEHLKCVSPTLNSIHCEILLCLRKTHARS